MPLKIAAKIDKVDQEYFKACIQPLMNSNLIEMVGEIGDHEKNEFLGNATAFLFPIDSAEPFGIVMIEAMACGVPIVAYPFGSVPEVIEHGVSGFLVDDVDGAVRALDRISKIDRAMCRLQFEKQFTSKRMAREYLDIYKRIVKRQLEMTTLTDGDLNWMKLASPSSTT